MKLIIGLGNPGEKYRHQRHNIGFILVDKLADTLNATWKSESKFKSEIAKIEDLLLIKPQTFMNLSGEAVQSVAGFYKIDPEDITVVHDEVDLELGKVKKQKGRSSAGHHGVEDIMEKLGTDQFWRVRVGIGKPVDKTISVSDWVLRDFESEELSKLASLDIKNLL